MEKKSSITMNVEAQMRLNTWKRNNEKARASYLNTTLFNLGYLVTIALLLRK